MRHPGSVRIVQYLLQPDAGASTSSSRHGRSSALSTQEALDKLKVIGYSDQELADIRAEVEAGEV